MDDLRIFRIEEPAPEVLGHGMNPAVRKSLTELSMIQRIGEENITKDLNWALNKERDEIGERYLGRTPKPRDA